MSDYGKAEGREGLTFGAGLPARGTRGVMSEPLAEFDLFGDKVRPAAEAVLKKRFIFPPFSVLSARDGDWQERKRAWLLTGIRSELGRGAELLPTGKNSAYGGNGFAGNRGPAKATPGGSAMPAADYSTRARGDGAGRPIDEARAGLTWSSKAIAEFDHYRVQEGTRAATEASSTSVFDPVLCELAYRWFSPAAGAVLDPFAGGSVRGIVASALGRAYTGVDLSAVQIAANREQADLCAGPPPRWIAGDSRNLPALLPPGYCADFVFSCPPYADLERYSDDPADLSTLAYPDFLSAYREIIGHCAAFLQPDSFACFVVGDVRGKDGNYYGFPADTAAAFRAAGMPLYNEAILVTAVGSLPVRINGQFNAGRKLGKTHQNVLVFLKGNAKKAAAKCGAMLEAETGAKEVIC